MFLTEKLENTKALGWIKESPAPCCSKHKTRQAAIRKLFFGHPQVLLCSKSRCYFWILRRKTVTWHWKSSHRSQMLRFFVGSEILNWKQVEFDFVGWFELSDLLAIADVTIATRSSIDSDLCLFCVSAFVWSRHVDLLRSWWFLLFWGYLDCCCEYNSSQFIVVHLLHLHSTKVVLTSTTIRRDKIFILPSQKWNFRLIWTQHERFELAKSKMKSFSLSFSEWKRIFENV